MKRYIKADIVDMPDEDEETLVYMAADPNLRPARIQQLFDMHNVYVNMGLAINPSTPPEMLRTFIGADNWQTHSLLAQNPSTPVDILEQLFRKKNFAVDYSLTRNKNCPAKVLTKIFNKYWNDNDLDDLDAFYLRIEDRKLRQTMFDNIAKHPNTPAQIKATITR